MRIRFEDCVFDSDTHEVLRGRRALSVGPKAFQMLEILIRERPKAVTKRQLRAELWPGVFVTEANLPNLITELRAALGDRARRPRIIRTVRGFGYAFSAPAQAVTSVAQSPADGPLYRLIWGNREIALAPGENVIGRATDSALFIDHSSVSRRHARILVKPSGDPGTAVAYGLGHGGIESILIGGLGMVQTLYLAILLNSGRLDTVLGPAIGPDMLAQVRATLEHLSITGLGLGTLERLIALLIQIGLSFLVWRAVERRQLAWLALAIAVHALIDFPPALFQAGLISTAMVEGVLLVIGAALVAYFLYGLPRKSAEAAKIIEPAP